MHSGQTVIYPLRGMRFYQVLLVLSKVAKAVAYFAAYDTLRRMQTISFLLILKISAVILLLPLQKPFSVGKPLRRAEWFQIAKYSVARVLLDVLWIEGLFMCGPFRFILLFEHCELIILAVASTLVHGASAPSKSRGTIFFILGVISTIFFDHDSAHGPHGHHKAIHKSFLVHKIYELFFHIGLSDHKVGVMVLLLAVCLDAGFAALSRTLVASIGGSKRLHALSSLVSLTFLGPIFLLVQVYNLSVSTYDSVHVADASKWFDPTGEAAVGLSKPMIFWILYIGFCTVMDFYFTSLISARLGTQAVNHLAKVVITLCAFVLCYLWSNDKWLIGFSWDVDSDGQSVPKVTHQLSTGAIFAMGAILYASSLMTTGKSGQISENGGSGHFIGYSMAGLPLFAISQSPAPGTTVWGGPESMGFFQHVRSTLKDIVSENSSRRIFAFLCLNLSFTFVELIYGVWSNSLGLISDGFHMLFDSAALVFGLYAAVVGRWKPTRIFSYGFHSVEILSGFVNALFLLVISCSVFVNALARIHQPPHIHTDRLMVVSVGGLIVNLVGVVALGHAHSHGGKPCGGGGGGGGGGNTHAHSHGGRNASHHGHSHDSHAGHVHSHSHSSSSDANLRGVYLHVLADTLGSVGVIFSSYLVSTYGWNVADPICSVFIACAIFYSSLPLLTDTVSLLTLRAPTDSQVGNPEQIVKKVLGLDGVLAVYNPFVWSHARDTVCASICVQVESTVPQQLILVRIQDLFATHYPAITQLTVQIEKEAVQDHLQVMGIKPNILLHCPRFNSPPGGKKVTNSQPFPSDCMDQQHTDSGYLTYSSPSPSNLVTIIPL